MDEENTVYANNRLSQKHFGPKCKEITLNIKILVLQESRQLNQMVLSSSTIKDGPPSPLEKANSHTNPNLSLIPFNHVVKAFCSWVVYLLPFYGLKEGDDGDWDIGVHKDGEEEEKAYFTGCGCVDLFPLADESYESHQKHYRIGKSDVSEQAFDHGRGVSPSKNAEKDRGYARTKESNG